MVEAHETAVTKEGGSRGPAAIGGGEVRIIRGGKATAKEGANGDRWRALAPATPIHAVAGAVIATTAGSKAGMGEAIAGVAVLAFVSGPSGSGAFGVSSSTRLVAKAAKSADI